MNARNKYYPTVSKSLSKTDDYNPVVRVDNGIIQVEITNEEGTKYWCAASSLMTKREAEVKQLEYLLNCIWSVAIVSLDLSKAELKRRMVSVGLISK